MGVSASLGDDAPIVEPGGSTAFDVTLRNEGPGAAAVKLRVTGEAKPYAYVVPASVEIGPAESAVARLGFRLPRASVPVAGPLAYELEAVTGDGATEVVATGTITVAAYSSLSTTLEPAEVSGAGPSTHELSIGNRGNSPVSVSLAVAEGADLDITITPTTVVAAPGSAGQATVQVTPRGRPFRGPDRDLPFTIEVTPEVGDRVQAPGRRRVPPKVTGRQLVTSGVVVGIVVLGLVVVALASLGADSGSSGSTAADDAPAPLSDCPARDHTDPRGVNGLRPDDIPKLPNTYSFLSVKSDGCTPIRFNPCEPVHYIQNAALAPPTGVADVKEGFARLGEATGITFVDDGLTDEGSRRNPYQPDRYGRKWAPILVNWSRFGNQGPNPEIQSVGFGVPSRIGEMIVSGVLSLNVDAVTNREPPTPLQGGFGPPIGTGTGAIGAEGVTWGRIILHELAHVVGLGHTRDKGAIMYPESAEQTSRPAGFRPPDLEGLRYLGREAGCLPNPPLPSS